MQTTEDKIPFHRAIMLPNLDLARRMIKECNHYVNQLFYAQGHEICGPLHYAAREGNVGAVQLLLEHGAIASLKDLEQQTPLHYVSCCWTEKSYDIYKLLLENGADPNYRDTSGVTPLHRALEYQTLSVVKLLLDNGADVAAVSSGGATALHFAVRNTHVDVIKFIMEMELFEIDSEGKNEWSALQYAAEAGNPVGCEFLLENGALLRREISDIYDKPLSLAILADLEQELAPETVRVLLDYGADIAECSFLKIAAKEDISEAVWTLLIQELAKLKSLNMSVNAGDLKVIKKNHAYKNYYQTCRRELRHMREANFYTNVSVFNVLMESKKVIIGYARNEELVRTFEAHEPNYEIEFPIYFPLLKKHFLRTAKQQRLRRASAKILSELFMFNDESHLVNQKILSYLQDDDLIL